MRKIPDCVNVRNFIRNNTFLTISQKLDWERDLRQKNSIIFRGINIVSIGGSYSEYTIDKIIKKDLTLVKI